MENSNTMGRRIMTLRKEQGLTQEQLAEKLGVSAQAVSKWENDISCPDISLIPQLADVLRVSTDELLGAKPVEPRVVVVDSSGSNAQGKKKNGSSFIFHFNWNGGIIFAVALIVVGLSFLLQRLGLLPFNVWSVIWPAVILAVGVSWLVNDLSVFGLGVALLGLYYLLFNLQATRFELSWGVIWPCLIVLFGISILLDKLVKNKKRAHGCRRGNKHAPVSEYSESAGYIQYDCAFSEDNRKVTAETFMGGNIDMSFGKSVLDLTSCKSFRPGAVLDVDVSFGSFELLLPRSVAVQLDENKAFGSITVRGSADAGATEALFIKGEVSFGSLLVRYL
ncbi:MAG: helix-turn-helix domain-containing protein [Clostridia bacterium]|nr:helix-turn-helix domain-containing protein [Clostridia bacterium]